MMLSTRLQTHMRSASASAFPEVVSREAFCPDQRPGGYLNFATADNYLLWDLLAAKLDRAGPVEEADSHYGAAYGEARLRQLFADLLAQRAQVPVACEQIVVAAGALSLLEMLAFSLCDPGDALLVPAPYYPRFELAFSARAGVQLLAIHTAAENQFLLEIGDLEAHLADARRQGIVVKGVLLSNPNNPCGGVYTAAQLDAVAGVCQREGLQLIVDEIYAESTLDAAPVAGAVAIDATWVHTVYGVSKDFGLSGFAVGVLHSRDAALISAARQQAQLARLSQPTQRLLLALLGEPSWTLALLARQRQRLRHRYQRLKTALEALHVPFIAPGGGLFVFINLRGYLCEDSAEGEAQLHQEILQHCRLLLSPGREFHCPQVGWFRWCYSVSEAALDQGLQRFARYLHRRRVDP